MRISINQPYLVPYAGFYRLLHEVDLHIIYDDCQIPYPGWVHRNQLTKRNGELDWLTIPLHKQPLETEIKDMIFAEGAADKWQKARGKFKVFDQRPLPYLSQVVALATTFVTPFEFIRKTMDITTGMLGITCPTVKSSRYKWSMFNRGQDRVIEMCKRFNATEYVNASGGADLYDPEVFEKAKIKLKILKPYEGSKVSILERLATEPWRQIKEEIANGNQFIS